MCINLTENRSELCCYNAKIRVREVPGSLNEAHKHMANDSKCSELGWVCVPVAVETYGN